MIDIRRVSAADVRPLRRGVPEIHIHDEAERTVHLLATVDGDPVGAVSAFDVSRTNAAGVGEWLVYGPFGVDEVQQALRERLVVELPPGARTWSDPTDAPAYTAKSIQILTGVQAVRKRPGMYVGSTSLRGLRALVLELVSNVVDEHLAGHATELRITSDGVGITVADDGRGIPPIALERVFTTLHYGSTAGGGQRTHVHAGMHGLGAAVVGALSSVVEVVVERDGRRWQQLFVQGEPVSELLDVAPTERRGTSVRFVPDRAIFDSVDVDEALAGLAAPLRDLAHLNPGLRMRIGDTHLDGGEGLISLARTLCGAEPYRELVASGTHEGVQVEVAVCWGARGTCTIGWGNQLPTVGSHLDGLERALERFGDREGRVALVAVMLQAPRFSGRTRRTLEVDAAREAVEAVIAAAAAGPQGARRA